MKISARNVLRNAVRKVVLGAVNAEVIVVLPGGTELVSIITKESVQSLGIEGKGKSMQWSKHPM